MNWTCKAKRELANDSHNCPQQPQFWCALLPKMLLLLRLLAVKNIVVVSMPRLQFKFLSNYCWRREQKIIYNYATS